MSKLFVYGTLRAKKESTHYLDGYVMYNAGPYPYILPAPNSDPNWSVEGNLVDVDDDEWATLDRYEGVDRGLYTREKITVQSFDSDHPAEEVWVYVGGDQWPRIKVSGDWYRE